MPFEERTKVDLRRNMVRDVLEHGYGISEAARKYGVSAPTVRLWVGRFEAGQEDALEDRSHAPIHCPHRTSEVIEKLIIEEKLAFRYGAKKLRQRLIEAHPEINFPSVPTFDRILAKHGFVEKRRTRTLRKSVSPFVHRYEATKPGEVTTLDFKGQFRMGNGHYCYPLTIADRVSRYIQACEALGSTHLEPVWKVILRVLRENGLSDAVQSDNGPPFGAPNGQFSTMAVRFMQLDILPVFSRPGCPQDNGCHERMHRELEREVTRQPSYDLKAHQPRFDEWRHDFNYERPHEALQMDRPGRIYTGGLRPFPSRIGKPEYPGHFEPRLVSSSGTIKWAGNQVFISAAFAGETIALEATDDGIWTAHYRRFIIGKFDECSLQFH